MKYRNLISFLSIKEAIEEYNFLKHLINISFPQHATLNSCSQSRILRKVTEISQVMRHFCTCRCGDLTNFFHNKVDIGEFFVVTIPSEIKI